MPDHGLTKENFHRICDRAMNRKYCEYCKREEKIETDNNGPIADCPICINSTKEENSNGNSQN